MNEKSEIAKFATSKGPQLKAIMFSREIRTAKIGTVAKGSERVS